MLDRLFANYLNISLTTSLLILILLILTPLLRKHYTAKWMYWLWMILAVRLLLPINFSFPNSLVNIQIPVNSIMNTTTHRLAPSEQSDPSIATQPIHNIAEPAANSPSLFFILSMIWIIGVAFFFLYYAVGYYTFRKQALRWSKPIASEQVASRITSTMMEMSVPSSVSILTSEKVPNPMLVGFRKPLLLLPHEQYADNELQFIIKHELVHYKRHDMLYKLLLLTVSALHWFNPFVWLLVREASREMELYCDDTVVTQQSLTYRKEYCEAILSAMQKPNPRFLPLSTNFSGGKNIMKQRFKAILSMKKKRNGLTLLSTIILVLGVMAACTNVTNSSGDLKPGTIYSSINENPFVSYDAGNSYAIDAEGNVSISYRDGEVTVQTPLKLDMTKNTTDRGIRETGFFISEDKTAIVYGPLNDKTSTLHVLISEDMGKTWNDYIIPDAKGHGLFIGFTSKKAGWMVSGHSNGVGSALNYVYQTSDGGKTWTEVKNPNDVYSEHLTGAGFANKDTGFLGYRYYSDDGPVIYWTKDQGQSWERLSVSLPEKFSSYKKNPLSPIFKGKQGLFPIALIDQDAEITGTIYLTSTDGGLSWEYDEKLDSL